VIAEQRDGLCTPLGTVRSSSRNAGPLGLWAGLCVVRTYVRCHVLSEINPTTLPVSLVFPGVLVVVCRWFRACVGFRILGPCPCWLCGARQGPCGPFTSPSLLVLGCFGGGVGVLSSR
jgi:hypothetical protein